MMRILEKEVDLASKIGDLALTEDNTLAGIVTARDIVNAFQMEIG